MDEHQQPPASNTGAQIDSRFLIDWLSITFPAEVPVSFIAESLNATLDRFEQAKQGMNGYKVQLVYGSYRLLTVGAENMGHHLILSGQGVRELESTGADVIACLSNWRNLGARATRIDIARDTPFNVTRRAVDAVKANRVTSRFRTWQVIEGSDGGQTVYFGSTGSRVRIRIYDKAAERRITGLWHRIELSVKGDRAEALAAKLDSNQLIGEIWAGVMNQYVRIEAPWWTGIINTSRKVKLTTAPPERDIEHLTEWFQQNMAPTLSTVFAHKSGDMDYLKAVLKDGERRRSHQQISMLERDR